MILELVDILIQPGKQAEFDQAIQHGIQTYIAPSKGFIGYRINKCIETPERYVLMNYWETLENLRKNDIMYLTREPMTRTHLVAGKYGFTKVAP